MHNSIANALESFVPCITPSMWSRQCKKLSYQCKGLSLCPQSQNPSWSLALSFTSELLVYIWNSRPVGMPECTRCGSEQARCWQHWLRSNAVMTCLQEAWPSWHWEISVWRICPNQERCGIIRVHFVNVPSQWEATLHCNVVSHWLGAFTKWSQHN